MKATIASKDDGEPVRFGDKSLRSDYNYETYNKNGNITQTQATFSTNLSTDCL